MTIYMIFLSTLSANYNKKTLLTPTHGWSWSAAEEIPFKIENVISEFFIESFIIGLYESVASILKTAEFHPIHLFL